VRPLALVLLFACSRATDKPAPAPATFDKLKLSLDGKPLAIDRAFMRHLSPDVFAIVLGAGKGSCMEDGVLGFTIMKRVAGTGHEALWITDVYSRDVDLKLAAPSKVTLTGTKLELPAIAEGKLAMSGQVDVVDCPAPPPSGMGAPKVTHKSNGRIIVAGKALDIKGVTVRTRPGVAPTDLPNITISTNVKDCSSVTLPAPVILERIDTKWSLRGTWFTDTMTTDTSDLAFNANGVGTSADGPTIELQLLGTGKLGDYTVKLEGTAEAIECVR
jgi:hypothetical protein